jgi:hypothetical protein
MFILYISELLYRVLPAPHFEHIRKCFNMDIEIHLPLALITSVLYYKGKLPQVTQLHVVKCTQKSKGTLCSRISGAGLKISYMNHRKNAC